MIHFIFGLLFNTVVKKRKKDRLSIVDVKLISNTITLSIFWQDCISDLTKKKSAISFVQSNKQRKLINLSRRDRNKVIEISEDLKKQLMKPPEP